MGKRRRIALFLLPAVLAMGTLSVAWIVLTGPIDRLIRPMPSTTVLDRHGRPVQALRSPQEVFCQPVGLDGISPWMVLATLATEDRRFYSHPGVDFRAVLRALWTNTREGRVVTGASTLTQQLARAIRPRPRTLLGKLHEMINALILEKCLGKEDILAAYLNRVSYGHACQGVEAAARTYFGVPALDLSLGQAAVLAAIPKSPKQYDPFRHPGEVLSRRKEILERMVSKGWVDPEAVRLALAERCEFAPAPKPGCAPHFVRHVRGTMPDAPATLVTTLDSVLQDQLQTLVQGHLRKISGNHVTNAAVLVLSNATGEVLSWVGSARFWDEKNQGQVDGVKALRQPGSALKPFLYALAFSQGMRPSDIVLDEPLLKPGEFQPSNYDDRYHGPTRLRTALACSYNVSAVRLVEQIGVESFWGTLREFGFTTFERGSRYYGSGLALGNGEVTMMELAVAYATLARGGVFTPIRALAGQEGPNDGVVRRVMDRETCYLVANILSDNAARAPAFGSYSPLWTPFPMAAKTGTTKDYRDNWAVGFTPEWTIAVWVGNFDGSPMHHVSGITGAAPILHDTALLTAQRYPTSEFARPKGIREVEICPRSGKTRSLDCPNGMMEVFRADRLPEDLCDLHAEKAGTWFARKTPTHIEFPGDGEIFKMDPFLSVEAQAIRLRVGEPGPGQRLGWIVDGTRIHERNGGFWWTLRPGRHESVLVERREEEWMECDRATFHVLP